MTSNRRTRWSAVLRGGLLLVAVTAAALPVALVTRRAAADLAAAAPHPESALVLLTGVAALVVLVRVAAIATRLAVHAARAAATGGVVHLPRRHGLERWVAGLVLGASGLAPQLAAAAPAAPAPVAVVRLAADAGPVDPTYLGPAVPAETPAANPAPPPATGPTSTTSPAGPAAPAGSVVEVRRGDTLWGIAHARLQAAGIRPDDAAVARAVGIVYAANHEAVGADPDLIVPGTRLVVPDLRAAARPAPGSTPGHPSGPQEASR